METRANYALIGIFTLAVVAGIFGFLYWFSGAEKQGGRKTYKIVFTGSISGLTNNGVVLFNGVPVGAVTQIGLMPQDPSQVYAMVEVGEKVPVRSDTKAQLEYTGFTGVASIALKGGASDAPPLSTSAREPGIIVAERSQFQDLVAAAQRIADQSTDFLTRVNHLIDENSASVTASVKNFEAVSGALATKSQDIKMMISDFSSLSAKLNTAADKVNSMLTNINGSFGTGESKGPLGDIAAAARSVKKVADDFDSRMKEIAANLNRFTGPGLREYEALAVDGRKTLEQINQAVRSIENNPQQFLFGK
ncbi:MAG TPA: MlaD family protein [Methylocella sp.]|nr:MlaD family protein [Methylocella sp.]